MPPDAHAAPPAPLPIGDGTFESFSAGLDGLSDAELASVYRERSELISGLEDRLGANRPRAQVAAFKLAARLKRSDPEHGCGLFGGVFYRAHRDGSGVRIEPVPDPRWRPPGGNRG